MVDGDRSRVFILRERASKEVIDAACVGYGQDASWQQLRKRPAYTGERVRRGKL